MNSMHILWIILGVYLLGAFLTVGFLLDQENKPHHADVVGITFFWPFIMLTGFVFEVIPKAAVFTVRQLKNFFWWFRKKRNDFKNRPKKVKVPAPVKVSTDNPKGQLEQAIIDRDELNQKIYSLEEQIGLKKKYR